MRPFHLAISLSLLLGVATLGAQAAPGYDPHPVPRHHAAPTPKPRPVPAGKPQIAPQHQPQQQAMRPGRHPAIQPGLPPGYQGAPSVKPHQPPLQQMRPAPRPPVDFRPVQVQIHANRHHIGSGSPLPHHVHIVRGKPLPMGWGKRLNAHQRRYVPQYHGYEWRRAGSDLVLMALATGIVHEILHGVLR